MLSLQFVDENLLPIAHADYGVDFAETEDDQRIIRTLTLVPGSVRLAGFQAEADDSIVYQQVVTVEDDDESQ